MRALSVSLTLCSFLSLSLSRSIQIPSNSTNGSGRSGLCEYANQQGQFGQLGQFSDSETFVPQCDTYGDFLPQQCWPYSGYCWCVNVVTGEEIPNTRTPLGSVAVDCERAYYCPHEWSRFGNQCFVFIDNPKTWSEAESYCMFEVANLASVMSPEEEHFIQALTRGDTHDFPQVWIGGHDAVHSCFWMWSDGSKFSYENWAKDYNVERNEHCLMMNYGHHRKWNYASCDDTLPFVCAKRI
ncbi:ladderlectin-like [Sebastes fasciatus]|uniref:ladderlectin-like n=1 Tax=Sebastes fasciatus TaxID=394691 RepID=UPI003D9DD026